MSAENDAKVLVPVKKRNTGHIVVASLMLGALLGTSAITGVSQVIPAKAEQVTSLNRAPKQGFADLVEKVMPSVVSIEVQVAQAAGFADRAPRGFGHGEGFSQKNPFEFFFDKFGDRRFGFRDKRRVRKSRAVGSGFIVSADGYVVTNNHVVKNATLVKVRLNDGDTYKAKIVGRDPKTDLAVLKIKADRTFKHAKLADKDPRVGDWVVAVGNPFGLGGTVTTGIVSASGRNIGSGPYDNFLQIDASINKGNSGGPAFNLNGEVIGVNTAIFSPSGGSVGIGFAIPASTTKKIVEDLINNGSVTRGWLGVQIQSISKDIADSLDLKSTKGTLVAKVTKGSPAEKGGLKTGDVILQVNGKAVKGPRQLARMIATVKPGSNVDIDVLRSGKRKQISLKLGIMPGTDKLAALQQEPHAQGNRLAQLGLAVEQSEEGQGVVVRDVSRNGVAAEKGIRPGDVIVEVAGIEVDTPAAMKAAMQHAKKAGERSVLVLVISRGRQRFIALPLKG